MTLTLWQGRTARPDSSSPDRRCLAGGLGEAVGDQSATAPQSARSRTQSRFRQLNELIVGLRRDADPTCPVDLVCECCDARCFRNLRSTVTRYREVCDGGSFAVLDYHPTADQPALAA